MRQLLLLRHAKSSWNDPGQADHDRPLNRRGREAAGRMAETFRRLHLAPELVLVSTARRTRETLAALEPFEGSVLIDPLESLYLAPAEKMLELLRATPETVRSVLLVGHNPGMQNLALGLAGAAARAGGSAAALGLAAGYPACALTEFAVASPWWGLGPGGGRLVRFITSPDQPDLPPTQPEQAA
jgi:phosphohistidine phosphatase